MLRPPSALARRFLRFATPLGLALSIAALPACDARVREIRSQLSEEDRALFDRGRQVAGPCWACHDFYGTQHKVGPHLSGLYGRRAGGTGFGAYSDGLRSTGVVWSRRTLDAFLANPAAFAPGTTMVSPGVPNAADRAALLFYIEQVTREER